MQGLLAIRRGSRFAVFCLAAWVVGCSGPSELDSQDAGRSVVYEPGLPNFDMEAIATLSDGTPGLDLYLSVPLASLVFTREGAGFKAEASFEISVLDERADDRVRSLQLGDTLRAVTYAATQSFRPQVRHERVDLAPGAYIVEAVLTDEASRKTTTRRQRVHVPEPSAEPAMTRMHIEVKRPGEAFEPQVALGVPTGFDSLRATVGLYNLPAGAAVHLDLHRLASDTSVARPGFWLSHSRASLEYKGVDYDAPPADTIQRTTRALEQAGEAVAVEVNLPPLPSGIYRVRVAAEHGEGAPPFAEQTREIAVREADFPRLTEVDDLIAPLAYITSERELEVILGGVSALERRRLFDAFWGSLFSDRRVASGVVRLYFERVEQANLLFSTFKEGWKTDRGMVYILFGPPEYAETGFNAETWFYDLSSQNGLFAFEFERSSFYADERPTFENWVLLRSNAYEAVWRQAVSRWRLGAER